MLRAANTRALLKLLDISSLLNYKFNMKENKTGYVLFLLKASHINRQ